MHIVSKTWSKCAKVEADVTEKLKTLKQNPVAQHDQNKWKKLHLGGQEK